jgi:hypothetical protein
VAVPQKKTKTLLAARFPGNPAILQRGRSVAFRPHLTMGLAFSYYRKLTVTFSGANREAQGGFYGVEMGELHYYLSLNILHLHTVISYGGIREA